MFAKDNITYELVKNTFHNISHKTVITLRPGTVSPNNISHPVTLICECTLCLGFSHTLEDNTQRIGIFPFSCEKREDSCYTAGK